MKLTVYKSLDGWRWRIRSRNGRLVCCSSESFARKGGAIRNLQRTYTALNDFMLFGELSENVVVHA